MENKKFLKTSETLRRVAKYILIGNRADAEDVAQEALKTIAEKCTEDELKHKGFKPWSYRVLKNKIGNYYQKKQSRARFVQIDDKHVRELPTGRPGPHELYQAQELFNAVGRAVAQLNESYRNVIWLLASGSTREEMMRALEVGSPRELRNKIFRSRKKLKELLAKEGYWI